jgi:hypothetical protein
VLPGAARAPLSPGYRPRTPEATLLYRVVHEHLESFLAQARARTDDRAGLPRFVEKELRAYLDCGVLARGFARVRCDACRDEHLVPFSCKGRGVCPSCAARRMADTAAHLVDRVIPRVPVRQWVLTFPFPVRFALAYDAKLLGRALTIFIRALFAFQRRRARALGLPASRSASVTFCQRFGSALQLTPHFHTLVPDGVFVTDPARPDARPRFHRLDPPSDDDVAAVLDRVVRRTASLLLDDRDDDGSAFAQCLGASLPAPARAARGPAPIDPGPPPRLALQGGFSLHADRLVQENDRAGLEQLCRYGLRPPLSEGRLRLDDDGSLRYVMKRRFSDGTGELLLTPHQFLRRLAALVPPPRVHMTRYHGLFASHAKARAALTGAPPRPARRPAAPTPPSASSPVTSLPELPDRPRRPRRLPWAELLRRVFKVDVLVCPRCQGPRRVIAFLTDPSVTAAILRHLHFPTAPPPPTPARSPPDAYLGIDDPAPLD